MQILANEIKQIEQILIACITKFNHATLLSMLIYVNLTFVTLLKKTLWTLQPNFIYLSIIFLAKYLTI